MGDTQVGVTNRALFKIGASAISDPNEASPQARTAKTLFAAVARTELRKHAWNFASARTTLAKLASAPVFEYLSQYQLPSDCLRLLYVDGIYVDPTYRDVSEDSDPAWAIEGGKYLSNDTANINILYTSDQSATPTIWDDAFCNAFACALAYECAPQLTKSDRVSSRVMQEYKMAIFEAKRANAIELPSRSVPDSSWVTARAF